MRPENLYPLFAPITALPGIGPRLAPLFDKLAGRHVVDLLWHLPYAVVDRRFMPRVAEAPAGRIATLKVRVDRHQPSNSPRRPYRVLCSDDSGVLHLVFFHAKADWLEKQLPVGAVRIVSGMVEHYNGEIQMTHPDHVVPLERQGEVTGLEPVYPLTGGLSPKLLAKAIGAALTRLPQLAEWSDETLVRRQDWPAWKDAVLKAHAPAGEADLSADVPARRRLAYDELLANQLALALVRASFRKLAGRSTRGDGSIRRRIRESLPFTLTSAQIRAVAEIEADLEAPVRMLRLLQGDVGSGKTVVALMAMAAAVETGAQAALMAPTEVLARQHLATLETLGMPAGLRIAGLSGRDKGKTRQRLLDALAAGEVDIVVGTHALFQDDVAFRDLALAVIDEQHRFGVHQRLDLAAKGRAVDMLVMTATPIPRTLMLTAYGDMDISRLDEKPPGRRPIDTRVLALARLGEVVAAVCRAIAAGAKVYWVCPLVEESEKSDLAAAEERHRELADALGPRVGLVHGRMKPAAKDAVMAAFAGDGLDCLVATTVIEVGLDVPAATVMVIEHAERFGLAQMHQLRGRVGRADRSSTCLLLYGSPLGETARARLNILRDSEDGFRIAEEDLRLRGAGELLGTRQSGLPDFRLADLAVHGDLLAVARNDAQLVLETDPDLNGRRGSALRTLLYLFERDSVVKTLRAG
jgi:ATP-dependent DNA helicase RecG